MPIPDIIEVQIPGIRGVPGASTVEAEAAAAAAVAAKTAAETAETNAETAATNAASSASAAATSATNAANSATAAATSETNAGNSATAAAASASAASTAATNASNSATAAETSETNAGNSATAAAGSATAAGNSATAAAGSASAAAASATAASADADRAEDAANSIDTSFLLDKPTYDTDEDGKVNAAEAADSAPWGGITGTPTTLAGYGITDAATAAQGLLADTAVQPGDLGTAAAEDVEYFATAAQGTLADSAVQPGDLGTAAVLDAGTAAGNVPVLDGAGLLSTLVLPALAVTDTFEAADETAMLALSAQKGDIAIRTDLSKSFVLSSNSPSTLADWKELKTPTDVVLAVAGLTGTISASDLRTALSLVVGTDVQAYSEVLTALAAGVALGSGALTIAGTASAGSAIRLAEDTDNGTHYVGLKAPDSIAADVTFALPGADGTEGQALTTDGAGNLSFGSAGISAATARRITQKYSLIV